LTVKAQKDVGTVYSEHEAINKTKAMYAAFVKGDKETFINFFTDTITLISNGTSTKMAIKNLGSNIDYWQGFANLSFNDDYPAVPKAIQYKKDGLWVLDWLRGIGIHKATGIRVDLPFTNEYRFNKDGKIDTWIQYADMTILTEIWKSQKTIESGVIYKYHPYINNTRKAVNAWAAKDMETWLSFYTPDAVFGSLSLKNDETIDLKTKKANTQKTFDNYATIVLVQSGEPVCVAYEREYYVVYSWWVLSVTAKDNKKKSNIPVMLTHGFDNNGKIKWESVYMDSKRLE
jgi:ketosteroid isomerase-like protein